MVIMSCWWLCSPLSPAPIILPAGRGIVVGMLGHTCSMYSGHWSPIMGQTLLKPGAQFTAWLFIGQLQSQSHSPVPCGQSHLQPHCMLSPPAGGCGPDPDPGKGTGCSPEPEPIGGDGPDPEPVGGAGPEPEPVTGPMVGCAASHAHLEIFPAPFLTWRTKLHPPTSTFPAPEHFLSHFAVPLQASFISSLKSQVHFLFPSVTFWPLKSS